MKRETFEKLKALGIPFDADFEQLAVQPLDRLKENKIVKKELDDEQKILYDIEYVTFLDQTLYNGKRNSANGYYYLYDGTFLGSYGQSNEIVVCAKKVTRENKTNKKLWFEFISPIRLAIENDEFLFFSGSIFAESAMGYEVIIKEEVFALATATGNFKRRIEIEKKKKYSYREAIVLNGTYGAKSPNYNNFIKNQDRNKSNKMKLAIAAVINELIGGYDYSNGGIKWDGIDIKTAKWKDGLKFARPEHDIFGLKDNKQVGKELWRDLKNGKEVDTIWIRREWEYRYITTAAYQGENKKRKNGKYPYFENDKVNMYRYGTTFMNFHPEFEHNYPIRTKKNEE